MNNHKAIKNRKFKFSEKLALENGQVFEFYKNFKTKSLFLNASIEHV